MRRIPIPPTAASDERLATAIVERVDHDGVPWVSFGEAPAAAHVAVPGPGAIAAGDEVVVLRRALGRPPVIVARVEARLLPEPEVLTLRAERELVLECGEASVRLLADGRIEIRGGYVETYAEGTNRIKGAQVKIN